MLKLAMAKNSWVHYAKGKLSLIKLTPIVYQQDVSPFPSRYFVHYRLLKVLDLEDGPPIFKQTNLIRFTQSCIITLLITTGPLK